MTSPTYPATRRAAVLSDFGGPENFSIREVPTPALRSDEMLVRVKATSVNPLEWKMRRGLALPKAIWRRIIGRAIILGIDFSGTVVAAGPDVRGYRIGDDVMGAFKIAGADTEYAVVRPGDGRTALAPKPPNASHAEAAAASFAGIIGLAGLTTHGGLEGKTNTRILVIGASGGVGHLAVQMAKRGMGAAFVVGVCSSKNEEFVRQCGADRVIAYDRVPIDSIADRHPEWQGSFDLILDAVGVDKAWTVLSPRLLNEKGRFVAAALPQSADGRPGEDAGLVEGMVSQLRFTFRRMTGRYRLIYALFGDVLAKTNLSALAQWIVEEKVAVKLAGTYTLDQIAEAHRASETGRTVGKIAVVIP